ncbi:filaggrin-2-like [Maniola jurtina]|uniref:filaggrin-2-like n=1 Tax=Maniola jurtina TaxID=191418 RepID=UPI001E68EE69|nr:filaggrin-2-like [Maniola jurtina]
MIAKFFIVLYAITFAKAGPVVYENIPPGVTFRVDRGPNIAFGFGSGFSSDIGGIRHSSGIGTSFQSGDATAYGAGFGSNDGNTFARGVGYANAAPSYPIRYAQAPYYPYNNGQQNFARIYNNGFGRFGSAVSSAQNFGNFGSAVSSAHSHNGFASAVSSVSGRGSAVSSVNGLGRYHTAVSTNGRGLGYDSAVASVSNGLGYESSISSAQNDGFGSSVSLAQGRGFNNFGTSVAASHNFPGYRASVAHSVQQDGESYQQSGASNINGVQTAHAINSDYNNNNNINGVPSAQVINSDYNNNNN